MKKLFCAFLCVLLVPVCWNAGTVAAEEVNAISVTNVEGYGETREKALADAFRNAVASALGTYVLSSTVDDGESVDEKIYLNADAVVDSHQVVSQRTEGGLVVVTINASVVRNEMMKYIQRAPSVDVDEGELANLLNKRKAIDTAAKSLDLLFANWQQNLFRVEKYGSMSIAGDDSLSGGHIDVSVPFILTLRWDNYRVWRKKLMTLVDRIAVAKTAGRFPNWRALEEWYDRTPFFEEQGVDEDNPNNYRGILFLNEFPGPGVACKLYLVPNQFYQKLSQILRGDRTCFRVVFSDSAGGEVLSHSIPANCWFCTGVDFDGWDISLQFYPEPFSGEECLVIREKVFAKADYDKVPGMQNLFHVKVSLPETVLGQIKSCKIHCAPFMARNRKLLREDGDEGEGISVTPLTPAQWQSIDPGPGAP